MFLGYLKISKIVYLNFDSVYLNFDSGSFKQVSLFLLRRNNHNDKTKKKVTAIIRITIFWSQRLAFDSMNSGYAYFKMLLLLNQKYYISVTLTCSGNHVGD